MANHCWLLLLCHHIIQTTPRINKLNHITISVHINKAPQLAAGINTREKDALVFTVDAKHNVTALRHIIIHNTVFFGKFLGQSLGPKAGPVGKIGAGIFGQLAGQLARVGGRKSEPDGAGPRVGLGDETDEDFLVDSDGTVGEHDGFAETFNSEKKRKNISYLSL